jgi:hypothetical protein
MDPEQFNQVIEAILDGKYSWACVLILRFAGYNPLHFIPYRTYNRLTKDNKPTKPFNKDLSNDSAQKQLEESIDCVFTDTENQELRSHSIQDLSYLEASSNSSSSKILGGWCSWFVG